MGLKRPVLERSLSFVAEDLAKLVKILEGRGVDVKAYKRDPKWRELSAKCRQIRRRINTVDAIAARDAECVRLKAAKAAAAAEAATTATASE